MNRNSNDLDKQSISLQEYGIVDTKINYNFSVEKLYKICVESKSDLESLGLDKTDLSMPSITSFGLGISKPKKWFLGAEYTSITSSVFSNDLINIENSEFEDSSKISFGGFYIPVD